MIGSATLISIFLGMLVTFLIYSCHRTRWCQSCRLKACSLPFGAGEFSDMSIAEFAVWNFYKLAL